MYVIILNSSLEKCFWSETVLGAVYIINRIPTMTLNGQIPTTIRFNRKPYLEKRSLKCLHHMFGYWHSGCKQQCPSKIKILVGKDVTFNKSKLSIDESVSENWIYHDKIMEGNKIQTENEKQVKEIEKHAEERANKLKNLLKTPKKQQKIKK